MTISCAAGLWCEKSQPVWIVAQKNVGVKNIAETMLKRAVDFKLLVSLEFYDGWWVLHTSVVFKCLHYFFPVRHEDLYAGFSQHVVTVDRLCKQGAAKTIGDSCVILCSLSMLSNISLSNSGIFDRAPVTNLVVDEASQIQAFDFMVCATTVLCCARLTAPPAPLCQVQA